MRRVQRFLIFDCWFDVSQKQTHKIRKIAATEGWIDCWKTRHGIRFVSISSEKLSADAKVAKEFLVKFQEIAEENELLPGQFYNIGETGLNYKMMPNKTLLHQMKPSQERNSKKIG